jgi:TusE/DsrC/DsvC family sulfur relay protein
MDMTAQRDSEGYLFDIEEWNENIARELALEEQLTLGDQHWVVINFIRAYFDEHAVIPDVRHVTAFLADQMSCSKKQAKQKLFELFPYGYVKQACKIAGMRKPRAWSTG